MIKKLSYCVALGLVGLTFSFSNAQAADGNLTNSGPGKAINFNPLDPPPVGGGTNPPFIFNPSPMVLTSGTSAIGGFVFSAVHSSALNKTDAKQYGMASDSNKVWWLDVSGLTAITDTATGGSNSLTLKNAKFSDQ